MSPESFHFTVSVPADQRLIGVVRDLCAHAVGYAKIGEADGAAFCDRVAEAAGQAVASRPDAPCPLVFTCTGGELRVTIAGRTLSQPLVA